MEHVNHGEVGRAYGRLTSILIVSLVRSYRLKQVPQIINTQIANTTITHGLKGGLILVCYPLKYNITYFLFFTYEMHILSTIIIQSKLILPKRYMLKLR